VMQPMHSLSQKQERTPPSTQYTGYLLEGRGLPRRRYGWRLGEAVEA
jgi:hypothetical protein